VGATLVSGLLLAAGGAGAETGPPAPRSARLVLPSCPALPFDEDDLLSSLRVELLSYGVELRHNGAAEAAADAVLVVVSSSTCSGDDLGIRIDNPFAGVSVSQALDLSDRALPERGRILALAIAELLRERWVELFGRNTPSEEPEAEPPPAAPPLVEEPFAPPAATAVDETVLRQRAVEGTLEELQRRRLAAAQGVHRVMITAAVTARSYPVSQGGLLGGQAGVSIRLSRAVPLRLEADLGYGYGGGTASIGDIEVQAALFGLSLQFHGASVRARGSLGPRVELGWGWSRGQPAEPDVTSRSVDGFVLSVSLAGGAWLRLSRRVWVVLEAQAGWVAVALEPRADGRRVGGISAVLIGLTLGIAVGL